MTPPPTDQRSPSNLPADPRELLAIAQPLAEFVAQRLVDGLDRVGPQITAKSTPTDLVTEMDTWAEAHITEALLTARPHDAVQGEEGADHHGTSGITWSIDPIDGTINYIHGLPGFCVSIAARVDGSSIAGVVVSPLHRDTFAATIGGGATRNGSAISVSSPASAARSVVGTGFGYDPGRRRRQAAVLAQVIGDIADVRRGGAAAVDLCSVACGRLDGYWEVGLNDWDHAAGALIAAEAGARCEGLDGSAPSERFILAAPHTTWDELADLLRAAGAADV